MNCALFKKKYCVKSPRENVLISNILENVSVKGIKGYASSKQVSLFIFFSVSIFF